MLMVGRFGLVGIVLILLSYIRYEISIEGAVILALAVYLAERALHRFQPRDQAQEARIQQAVSDLLPPSIPQDARTHLDDPPTR